MNDKKERGKDIVKLTFILGVYYYLVEWMFS